MSKKRELIGVRPEFKEFLEEFRTAIEKKDGIRISLPDASKELIVEFKKKKKLVEAEISFL